MKRSTWIWLWVGAVFGWITAIGNIINLFVAEQRAEYGIGILIASVFVGIAIGWFCTKKVRGIPLPPASPKTVNINRAGLEGDGVETAAVQILFRDVQPIDLSVVSLRSLYTYSWPFDKEPVIGQWVRVIGMDGLTTAVIAALGVGEAAEGMELVPVSEIIPDTEVQEMLQRRAETRGLWFKQALDVLSGAAFGQTPVEGHLTVPPLDGRTNSRDEADTFGKGWWKLYKEAEQDQLPEDIIKAFKQAAETWFSRRDNLR